MRVIVGRILRQFVFETGYGGRQVLGVLLHGIVGATFARSKFLKVIENGLFGNVSVGRGNNALVIFSVFKSY